MGYLASWRRLAVASIVAAGVAAGPGAMLAGVPALVTAVDDAYEVAEDSLLTVPAPGILGNDTGPSPCIVQLGSTNLQGQLNVAPDGGFTFMPSPDVNGPMTFTYGIASAVGGVCPVDAESEATVSISVTPVNDAPIAAGDTFQFVWGQTLNIPGPGVLANDSDVDGDPLTAVKVNDPTRGSLTLAANGGFSYTPAAAACPGRADAFSYRASDGTATSPIRVVQLNPATVPCPTPVITPPPAAPTPTPEPEPTVEASPSPSPEPTPTAEASPSAEPSAAATPSPAPSGPGGPVNEGGGLPLPVLLVGLPLLALLAIGAAFWFARWLEARRAGGGPRPPDDPRIYDEAP